MKIDIPTRRPKKTGKVVSRPKPVAEEVDDEAEEVAEVAPVVKPKVSLSDVQSLIQKRLNFKAFVPEKKYFLAVDPLLGSALGSEKKGIAYGTIMELHGIEHGGKTLIGLILAGLAQRDGAAFVYVDLEESSDGAWMVKLKVDPENVMLIQRKLILDYVAKKKRKAAQDADDSDDDGPKKKKKADEPLPVLQSIESVFEEIEATLYQLNKAGFPKIFMLVDSVAFMQTEMTVEAGHSNQNMRTNSDLAMFLKNAMPRMTAFAANYNVLMVFINQLRDSPGVMYGPSEHTPGGRALRHACHVRGRVARIKSMKNGTKKIGLIGKITNIKNKHGSGSVEGAVCGFTVRWDGRIAAVDFLPLSVVVKLAKGE